MKRRNFIKLLGMTPLLGIASLFKARSKVNWRKPSEGDKRVYKGWQPSTEPLRESDVIRVKNVEFFSTTESVINNPNKVIEFKVT